MEDKIPSNPNSNIAEDNPKVSSALAVVAKKPDDLVEEDIDSQILSILGLEDVFDLTYEEYASLLKEAAVKGRMPGSQMTTENVELVTNELKRVKNKTGRFKVKPKKVDINKVLNRKQPTPPGAIVKAQKLIPPPAKVSEEKEKPKVDSENLQSDLLKGIGNILESLITIRSLLQSESKTEQKAAQEDRKETEKKKKKERESKLEEKKPKSPILKALTKPVDDFFGAIKKFFTNVLLGSVVLAIFKWLKNPENQKAVDGFANFLQKNAGLILGGLLAIALLPIAPMLLGLTKTLLGGAGLLGGALGKLGSIIPNILRIPGVGPAASLAAGTAAAAAAGLGATALFRRYGVPVIEEGAARLDLGTAAAQDPLVREGYSRLKEAGKAYTEKVGRGGNKGRVEKSTSEMTAEEKKIWDAARSKESKARELAMEYSKSNQDLYDLNEKLKNLQKEKPRNVRGGSRTQADINTDIQSVKEEIKAKEKEKAAKKKTLYKHLSIDPNKPQVQPQTPAVPGASSSQKGSTGSATFGETGNVSNAPGFVHGHFQTNAGTANDLVNDTAPIVKGLLDSGVTPELSKGQKFTPGMSMEEIKKLIRVGITQHSHSGDGRSVDIFVPKGTKVPFPLADVRNTGGRGGVTGILPGSGKVWVGHLAPTSKSGMVHAPVGETTMPAQIAQTPPPTPSIPSPTGRSNIVPIPIPTGGGTPQVSSGTSPNQAIVPRFSSEDPNNTTTMVVRAIYNIVG